MADLIYDYGNDLFGKWGDGSTNFKWMLLKSTHAPDQTDQFVSAVVADEVTASGYARNAVGAAVRAVDTALHRTNYSCNTPSMGTIASGQTYQYLVVFLDTASDATSTLVGLWDLTAVATAGVPVQPVLGTGSIVHYLSAV